MGTTILPASQAQATNMSIGSPTSNDSGQPEDTPTNAEFLTSDGDRIFVGDGDFDMQEQQIDVEDVRTRNKQEKEALPEPKIKQIPAEAMKTYRKEIYPHMRKWFANQDSVDKEQRPSEQASKYFDAVNVRLKQWGLRFEYKGLHSAIKTFSQCRRIITDKHSQEQAIVSARKQYADTLLEIAQKIAAIGMTIRQLFGDIVGSLEPLLLEHFTAELSLYLDMEPPASDAEMGAAAEQTSADTTDKPPPYIYFRAAIPVVGSYGQILHIRPAGIAGKRVLVNRGTAIAPIYQYLPGSLFSKEELDDAASRVPTSCEAPPKWQKGENPEVTFYVEMHSASPSMRRPLGLFGIEMGGTSYFITRSELIKRCGKGWVEPQIIEATEVARRNEIRGEYYRQRDLHPDTERALTEADKAAMPWLAKSAFVVGLTKKI